MEAVGRAEEKPVSVSELQIQPFPRQRKTPLAKWIEANSIDATLLTR